MINNSATSNNLGKVNGIAQASAAFVRAIGPAIGGRLWTFSLKTGLQFPFNHHLSFVILTIFSVFAWLSGFLIPRSAEIGKLKGEETSLEH